MQIYLSFVLCLAMWSGVQGQGCFECAIRHPQREICMHDFAIKARVKNSSEATADYEAGTGYRSHEVKVFKWFKRPAGVDEDDSIVVLNHKGDLACGATLEEEKMYLIIGNYNETDGSYHVPMCSLYTSEWKSVAAGVKRKLGRGLYVDNCDCLVRLCEEVNLLNMPVDPSVSKEECLDGGNDFCTADNLDPKTICTIDLAICRRNDAGKCQWKSWSGYKKCVKEAK